jgi:PAS domain S-box-containing protein
MPHREFNRQLAVNKFLNQSFGKEQELQEVVEIACRICGTSSALLTLVDHNTQHIIFKTNFKLNSTDRGDAFCNYIVETRQPLLIRDTLLDHRFANNPLVIGDPYIRFYAGIPLESSDGHTLGSLCVIDGTPGQLSEDQLDILKVLAKQAVHLMNFDTGMQIIKNLTIDAKKSEIELRSFFESSIDHHLLLGKNFEVLAFNKSYESHVKNTYGLQMERGSNMIQYIKAAHLHDFYKDYNRALNGTAVFDERNLQQEDGDSWRIVKFEPAFDVDGEIIGVSVNVSDVNTRVQNEQIVKLQNLQLQEIAMMQSHELRRPVASILGLMSLFKASDYKAEKEDLQMLERAVAELDLKIRDIVSTAKIQ